MRKNPVIVTHHSHVASLSCRSRHSNTRRSWLTVSKHLSFAAPAPPPPPPVTFPRLTHHSGLLLTHEWHQWQPSTRLKVFIALRVNCHACSVGYACSQVSCMVARVYAAFVAAWRLVYLHVPLHINILCMQSAMWSQQPGWAGGSAFQCCHHVRCGRKLFRCVYFQIKLWYRKLF